MRMREVRASRVASSPCYHLLWGLCAVIGSSSECGIDLTSELVSKCQRLSYIATGFMVEEVESN